MDLKKLRDALNSGLPEDLQRHLVIKTIADDENAIPDILDFLSNERKLKKKLIEDFNLNLSRAHLGLEKATYKKGALNYDHFIEKEIEAFYHKYKDVKGVGHLFKKLDELRPSEKKETGFYSD